MRLARPTHVFVLGGFAVAQPLFDVLARNPEFLIAHRAEPSDLVLLAIGASFALPTILVGLEAVARMLGESFGDRVHGVIVALLAMLVVLPPLNRNDGLPGALILATGMASGVVASLLVARTMLARTFLIYLAPAIVIFPALFLSRGSIAKLVAGPPPSDRAAAIDAEIPVVVAIFDELPLVSLLDADGEVDRVRYPSFAALADGAHWFRNATAIHGGTVRALPAILTGRYPGKRSLPTVLDHPRNLFTELAGSYALTVMESATRLCPEGWAEGVDKPSRRRRLLSLGVDLSVIYAHMIAPKFLAERIPPVHTGWGNFLGDRLDRPLAQGFWDKALARAAMSEDRPSSFRKFLSSIRPRATRHLYFLHTLLPHQSWVYLPSGQRHTFQGWVPGMDTTRMPSDPALARHAWQRHLLQVGLADRLLGELVDAMKRAEIYDAALLIVAADHGISFQPGGAYRTARKRNAGETMWVPFFVKLPGQRQAERSERNVEIVDVLPTIADVLGFTTGRQIDGRSAFDASSPERPQKRWFRGARARSFPADPAPLGEALRRKVSLFGSGDVSGLYRIGPFPDLLERRVSDLPTRDRDDLVFELTSAESYRDVHVDGAFVPAHVQGTLKGPGARSEAMPVAVAIDGVIRASSMTYRIDEDELGLSVMVPPESFHEGANEVQVLIPVRRQDGGTSFERPAG